MRKTWVVVADRSRARFFSIDTPKGPLKEFDDLVYPEARLQRDRTNGRTGHEHHTIPPAAPAKEHETTDFAREVAARADAGRIHGDFQRLVLVASPEFLGALRKKLPAPTAKLVGLEIDKNVAQLSAEEIRRHLPEIL